MIKWFFKNYIKDEFSIQNFSVTTPSNGLSYLEKCRLIVPEIERILKQFTLLVNYGKIDKEFLQFSSFNFKISQVKSLIEKKYVYITDINDQEGKSFIEKIKNFKDILDLLFSKSNLLSLLPQNTNGDKNFFNILNHNNIKITDLKDYQINLIKFLYDKKLINYDKHNYIRFVNKPYIEMLEYLYNRGVLNYYKCSPELRNIIDSLVNDGILKFESTLLTRQEQDYFNFYMNKAKFTNGDDLRNKYSHGTNDDDPEQNRKDYYYIIRLIIILILKINDDLCLFELTKNNP